MAAQFDLRGKVAIVTGASSGIGRATALALARNGAAVIVNYHKNEKGAEETVAGIQAMRRNALAVRADVSQRVDVLRMIGETVDNFGGVDILVNNAGSIIKLSAIEDCTDDVWDAVMGVNLKGVFLCSQTVIPYMKEKRNGRIINISSGAVEFGGMATSLPYAAAKAAVNTFTKGLSKELGHYNITVNAIAPGVILTPIHDRFSRPEWLHEAIKTTPLGRAGGPEEVAEFVAFLASDEAGFITGEVLGIDGGR
ncbi:MAG: 3-oxoacyl-ACP reductase FabG [Acidobacteriota bacterium]|nr:3-oxoacyl-ACP reductase FabG [Acidobacteriota bacterium]